MYALYVTHPEVVIDPNAAMPRWGLSSLGKSRAERFANHPLVSNLTRLVSSTETKALELAAILASGCGAPVDSGDKLDENDRRSTGFVPSARFEALADALFAHPDESAEGWETARDAQRRVVGGDDEQLTVVAEQRRPALAPRAPSRPWRHRFRTPSRTTQPSPRRAIRDWK